MEKKNTEKDLVFYNPPNFSFSPKKTSEELNIRSPELYIFSHLF